MKELNEDKKRLAEENHKLIYSFLRKYSLNEDDYYDIVAIGYMNAVNSYNSSKGMFSTIAYISMLNEVKKHFRYQTRVKYDPAASNIKVVSLNEMVTSLEEPHELIELIMDPNTSSDCEHVEIYVTFLAFFKQLTERDKEILRLKESGLTQYEIAKALGVTQPVIGRRLKEMLNSYKRFTR